MIHVFQCIYFVYIFYSIFTIKFVTFFSKELSKPAIKVFNHNLLGILESAVRATTCQFEDEDILNRLDTRMLTASSKDLGWDVFCLDYKVDGPISSVRRFKYATSSIVSKCLYLLRKFYLILGSNRRCYDAI